MADDLEKILESHGDDFSNEELEKYLRGELPADDSRRLEMAMMDSGLLSDAVEGLQDFNDASKLPAIKRELESSLQQYLAKRKEKKHRRKIRDLSWVMIFIVVILLLILISFAVVYINR